MSVLRHWFFQLKTLNPLDTRQAWVTLLQLLQFSSVTAHCRKVQCHFHEEGPVSLQIPQAVFTSS